jgi:hypothetical protein
MKSNNNNNNNNNNTAMGSVHARGDTFLTFGLKALTETNTSRLATGVSGILNTHIIREHKSDSPTATRVIGPCFIRMVLVRDS